MSAALITRRDLRGDLHSHTFASDGAASTLAMATAARENGLQYLAITNHSRYHIHARGLDAAQLAQQRDEIDELNEHLKGVTLLHGVEVDILEDGSLALPDAVLATLDVVVASVHDHVELGRERQTTRLLRVLDRPYVCVLGHPTARLLGERAPIECDWTRIFRRAAERPLCLELNCQPKRLDLDETLLREAIDAGALISINSDAHAVHALRHLADGAAQAQRCGVKPGDVINTLPLPELRARLRAMFLA